jgi:hypothetical protein
VASGNEGRALNQYIDWGRGVNRVEVRIKRNSPRNALSPNQRSLTMAMHFRLLRFSNVKTIFCARFHVIHSPGSSATACQMQAPSGYPTSDRRLDIFLEQQIQPWNASKLLEAGIIVNVILPDGLGGPRSFSFDARSPAPTPAQILSILPNSMKCTPSSNNSANQEGFAPIAAAVNGRVVGLGNTQRSREFSKCAVLF